MPFDRRELPAAFWFLWLGTIVNRLAGAYLGLSVFAQRRQAPAR